MLQLLSELHTQIYYVHMLVVLEYKRSRKLSQQSICIFAVAMVLAPGPVTANDERQTNECVENNAVVVTQPCTAGIETVACTWQCRLAFVSREHVISTLSSLWIKIEQVRQHPSPNRVTSSHPEISFQLSLSSI